MAVSGCVPRKRSYYDLACEMNHLREQNKKLKKENALLLDGLMACGDPQQICREICPVGYLETFNRLPDELLVKIWKMCHSGRFECFRLVCHAWNDLLVLDNPRLLSVKKMWWLHISSKDDEGKVILSTMQWRPTASRRAPRHPYLECPIEHLQQILGCVRLSAGYSKLIVTLEKNSAVLVLQALVNCRHALCPKHMIFKGNLSAVASSQMQQTISQHQRKDLDLKFEDVEIDNALLSNGLLQLNGLRSIVIMFPSSNSSIGENGLLAMLQHSRLRTITLNGFKDISAEHIEKFYKEWRKLAKKKKDSGRPAGVNLKLNIIGCTHLRNRVQVNELAHLLDRNSKTPFWHFQSNGSKLAIQIRGADHPDEWEKYSAIGKVIEGTRFIAFKTPLKPELSTRIGQDHHFNINTLLFKIAELGGQLGLVIDLTNTDGYYDRADVETLGIAYTKLYCPGHEVNRRKDIVKQFIERVDKFLSDNDDNDMWIGVHCTHGINRTGYLISRYLIDRQEWTLHAALEAFEKARGYSIERVNYVQSLHAAAKNRKSSTKRHIRKSPVAAV